MCLTARNSNRSVEAFLYLYRMLEMVSVALPLVYAASEPDFKRALSFIKALSSNPRDGDLAIFAHFVGSLEGRGGYKGLTFDFKVQRGDAGWNREAREQIEKFVLKEIKGKPSFLEDGITFQVPFSSMPSFVATFRNRLFHNSQSGSNFRLDPLHGAAALCEFVIDPTLSWLTMVVIEIVKTHARPYV